MRNEMTQKLSIKKEICFGNKDYVVSSASSFIVKLKVITKRIITISNRFGKWADATKYLLCVTWLCYVCIPIDIGVGAEYCSLLNRE